MKKDVAIIILNYNSSHYTLACVNSIYNEKLSNLIDFEVIVVDNNSDSKDYDYLKRNLQKHANLKIKRNEVNSGFGGGNMFGFSFSYSRYTLFLNNDTLINKTTISDLYNYMEQHPEVGVCSAQNYDTNGNFVPSFDHFKGIRKLLLGRSFLEYFFSNTHPKRKLKHNRPIEVDFINGACMFFRTTVFTKVGGFDTEIFLYFEEMDICQRIKHIGYKNVLLGNTSIIHDQGGSTQPSFEIECEGIISYLYVLKKNYSFWKFYLIVQSILKPKRRKFYKLLCRGASTKFSLKHKQKVKRH